MGLKSIILLIAMFFILLGIGFYYYLKYEQEIKTYGLYILIGTMIFIFFIAIGNQPKRQRSPDEQRAYEEERGRLEAQREDRIREEQSEKPFSTGFESPLADMLMGKPRRKRRKRK